MFGTAEQQERVAASRCSTARSAPRFAMTEPAVATSDATNIAATHRAATATSYVINGRKWWTTGVAAPRTASVTIVMGAPTRTPPPHRQQSMILVPLDTPGVDRACATCRCSATHDRRRATARSQFDDVRVPAANLLGEEGGGFAIAQARLGPGPHPPLHARHRRWPSGRWS